MFWYVVVLFRCIVVLRCIGVVRLVLALTVVFVSGCFMCGVGVGCVLLRCVCCVWCLCCCVSFCFCVVFVSVLVLWWIDLAVVEVWLGSV